MRMLDMRTVRVERRLSLLSIFFCAIACSNITVAANKETADVDAFLSKHWSHPFAVNSELPNGPDGKPVSLAPQNCGQCHPAQFGDWKTSRHSMAMGPGILGQLITMAPDAHKQHRGCTSCHAPLAEQAADLSKALASTSRATADGLHRSGLICAACHVRESQWYGPARRDGSEPDAATAATMPHAGWTVSAAFEDSRFCSTCHQFKPDGYALNGKLLENTYAEWQASRYAREGVTCQNCHMPDRRHLWRGIHDPEMVASGVTIETTTPATENGFAIASLTVRNTGTGHYFPTYVTPAVIAEIWQQDAAGKMLPGTLREQVIARKVPTSLREELFDTRIPPDEQITLSYREPVDKAASQLGFRVRVEPDAFYSEFFTAMLKGNRPDDQRAMLEQAQNDADNSGFGIYASSQSLTTLEIPQTIPIPDGRFIAGSDDAEREVAYQLDEEAYGHSRTRQQGWYSRERKRGTARTRAFSITTTPITNGQYAAFVRATGHPAPDVDAATWKGYRLVHPFKRTRRHAWKDGEPPAGRKDHPVVLVSYNDARAYATWLGEITGKTWRLPLELEWEKAARGTEGDYFPWGDEYDKTRLNSHDNGPFDTLPVGNFPAGASPFGMLDAAGQVFEWTGTETSDTRALVKGGSWDDSGCGVCRPAARHGRPKAIKHILIGFRLVHE